MDSELQDAFNRWDSGKVGKAYQAKVIPEPILDAARKVANPDYEAAYEALTKATGGHTPMAIHPATVRQIINAALGIIEDTE